MGMPDKSLTEEQERIAEAVRDFVTTASPGDFFVIQGLAGTGKTTLMTSLDLPGAVLVAPTGKAASVLRAKSDRDAMTIHSAIYNFCGTKTDENGKLVPIFVDKDFVSLPLVLLDESSMVGQSLATDLLATGAVVVAFGDPGQLPPVKDRQFFNSPDATLREIHRQALDSPIIRQAHRIRNGERAVTDGDGFVCLPSSRGLDLTSFGIVLCWTNKTRTALNSIIRKAKGIEGPSLFPGEPVMCLRNDYARGIFNGEIYRVAKERAPGTTLWLEGGSVIPKAKVERFDGDFDKEDDETTPFALAYASTCHKFQGSEEERVLVFDEMGSDRQERARWLYTAVTRARSHVTVVRPEDWG